MAKTRGITDLNAIAVMETRPFSDAKQSATCSRSNVHENCNLSYLESLRRLTSNFHQQHAAQSAYARQNYEIFPSDHWPSESSSPTSSVETTPSCSRHRCIRRVCCQCEYRYEDRDGDHLDNSSAPLCWAPGRPYKKSKHVRAPARVGTRRRLFEPTVSSDLVDRSLDAWILQLNGPYPISIADPVSARPATCNVEPIATEC